MTAPGDLRVLMTTDAVGGVWTYATTLASALRKSGCEVVLVNLGRSPTEGQRRALCGTELVETDLMLEWDDPEGLDMPRARPLLEATARRHAPDIIHLNGYREATYQWPAPVIVVAHSCVMTWAEACHELDLPADPKWRLYASLVRDGLQAADAWVAPSASFRDQIASHYGIGPGVVIWNGWSKEPTTPATKQPFVLAAGRCWDRGKNLGLLSTVGPLGWALKIAGAGRTDTDATQAEAPSLQYLDELPHEALMGLMQHASIFVSPARYEPFGLSVLEAASEGCALVLSDIASFRELWDGAALFAPPDDARSFAAQIGLLIRDESLRVRLQSAASARAETFSAARMAEHYLSLYRSVLRKGPRNRPDAHQGEELRA